MDDFVINVRQISQYPDQGVQPSDIALLQRGFGGPYLSASTYEFVAGAISGGGSLVSGGQITAPQFVVAVNGSYSWAGSGQLSFNQTTGWTFSFAEHGLSSALFNLRLNGTAQLPFGTLQVARDPFEPFEVATANYVTNNTVASFNGRTGAVTLTDDDVHTAFGVSPNDTLATQSWVNATICEAVPSFINQNPFVFTFNGRVGDITLTTDDIANAYFTSGTYPTAPSPALGDASNRIATTLFVDESIEEMATTINNSWNAADYELLNIIQTYYAPLLNPAFGGVPTAPTASPGNSTAQLATTAFVMAAVTAGTAGVSSFNTRTGAVVLTQQDIINANGWSNVNLTGVPLAPTAPNGTQTNQIATTAFVLQEIAAINSGVLSFNGRSGVVSLNLADLTGAGGAPIASPNLTGVPSAPTATPGTSTTQLATTAFVAAAIGNSVASFNGRTGAVTLQANDISAATGALIASPTFTGVPAGPTATAGTNTTQLATTAFVATAIASAGGVASFNTRTGPVTLNSADVNSASGVLYSPQTLAAIDTPTTPSPQTQARQNIYAAPLDAWAYYGLQVNGATEVMQYATTQGNIVDGWKYAASGAYTGTGTWAVSTSAPNTGFVGSVSATSTINLASPAAADNAFIFMPIEQYRMVRLAWGSAAAAPLSIAFWVKAHRPGNYAFSIRNNALTRSYVTLFPINSADTWEYKTITVPGDVSGSWNPAGNTIGMNVSWTMVCGSSAQTSTPNTWVAGNFISTAAAVNGFSATSDIFQVTGVTILPGLEVPSAARSVYAVRPIWREFNDCQRYYSFNRMSVTGNMPAGQSVSAAVYFARQPMRVPPTVSGTSDGYSSNANCTFQGFTSPSAYGCDAIITIVSSGYGYISQFICIADARM